MLGRQKRCRRLVHFFALSVKSYCKAERKSFLNYFTNWTLGNAAWQAFASCTTARQPSFWWGWVVAQSCPALGPISAGGATSWPCWPWTPVSICKILVLHHFESQFKSVMTFLLASCFLNLLNQSQLIISSPTIHCHLPANFTRPLEINALVLISILARKFQFHQWIVKLGVNDSLTNLHIANLNLNSRANAVGASINRRRIVAKACPGLGAASRWSSASCPWSPWSPVTSCKKLFRFCLVHECSKSNLHMIVPLQIF